MHSCYMQQVQKRDPALRLRSPPGIWLCIVPVNSFVSEILSHPVNQPLSPTESQLQTNLVKRSLPSSPTKGMVVLKTHGKVVKLSCALQVLINFSLSII